MADVKMTKKDWYEIVKDFISGARDSEDVDAEGAMEFIDRQIELLDAKASKARERASAKRQEADELREAVEEILTETPQTIDEIAAQITIAGATKSMITARLTQLVKAGIAEKESVKEGTRKLVAYHSAQGGSVE